MLTMNFNVQIVHYSPLRDRKKYLLDNQPFKNMFTFHTEKSVEISQYSSVHSTKVFKLSPRKYGFNLGVNSRLGKYSRKYSVIEGIRLNTFSMFLPKYRNTPFGSIPAFKKDSEIQLEICIMHLNAIKKGFESLRPWILILEDDAIFSPNWNENIEKICNKYHQKKDIYISLNSGAGMFRSKSDPFPDEFGIYRVRPIATRCATGYLISRRLASKIIHLFDEFGIQDWLPIDIQLQICLQKIKAETYWQDPPIFIQGSESGYYKSNLR